MNDIAERFCPSELFPDELPKQHEVVRGMLVRKAMPSFEHGDIQGELRVALQSCSVRRGGRWWLSSECEIEFGPGERYLPDLAGWDSTRVAERPSGVRVRIMPQWVCEILSPSTAARDRGPKRATYHAAGVSYYWQIDMAARTLAVLTWSVDGYRT
ncbi:MAG: Uma2 family endonuclease, partial [Myxococcota bacterium]